MSQPHPARGYLYIASATFLWGVSAALGRAAFTGRWIFQGHDMRSIDPLILAQSRTTISFLVLLPVLLARRGWDELRISRRDVLYCFVLGIGGVAASNYFYYLAIQRTNVAVAIIVQYTAPIWVLLYMVLRGLQSATRRRIASVGLAVTGSALAIGLIGAGQWRLDSLGLAAAILAAFSFAFYNVFGHGVLARHERWKVLLYTTLGAALFWQIVNPPWKIAASHYSFSQWIFLGVFSLVSVLAPFAFYFAGLQHLEPTRAIVASCLEPVFSIVIAALALGEKVDGLQVAGIALVLTAIVIAQLPEPLAGEQPTVVEPME
jgi:drug/metabolite transporter (DMT)-like permease